jgi:hypothetical protein
MKQGRYGSREILNAMFIDYVTNKPFMYFDYANTASNEWTADVTYATGGSGAPRRISFFGNRQSTLTFETQIFSLKHLAMLAGRDIESSQHNIFKREVVTVKDNAGSLVVNLQKAPLDLSSMTILKFENGIATTEVTPASFNNTEVELTGPGIAAGDEVEVYYQFRTTTEAHKLRFTTKNFPKYIKIVGDTVFADEAAEEAEFVSAQLIYYKARLQPNFTLNLSPSGDPTTLSLAFDIFPVKVEGEDTMADLILYND